MSLRGGPAGCMFREVMDWLATVLKNNFFLFYKNKKLFDWMFLKIIFRKYNSENKNKN